METFRRGLFDASKDRLLDNLRRSNSAIQEQQRLQYRELLDNTQQGVKAKSAF